MLTKLIEFFRKRKILRLAKLKGCDVDGDLITYKRVNYYVCPFTNTVERIVNRKE